MNRKIILLLVVMLNILYITSCSTFIQNNKEQEVESNTNSTERSLEMAYNQIIFRQTIDNITLDLIEKDDTIDRKYYSPNSKEYISEKMSYFTTPSLGGGEVISNDMRYFYGKQEVGLAKAHNNLLPKEKNLLPKPVWLHNNGIILSGFDAIPTTVNLPNQLELKSFYGSDINSDGDKLVLIGQYFKYWIYDIGEEKFYEIYKGHFRPMAEMHLNVYWGNNNNIYFDDYHISTNEEKISQPIYTIRKYNLETGKVEDFIENGFLLAISPNKRFLAYVSEIKEKTIIMDLKTNQSFEIPLSIELDWTDNSNEFYYIPVESVTTGKIVRARITPKGREITEWDVSSYLKNGQILLNLYYDMELGILFDIGTYELKEFNPQIQNAPKRKEKMLVHFSTFQLRN